jgi:hypothetical protein
MAAKSAPPILASSEAAQWPWTAAMTAWVTPQNGQGTPATRRTKHCPGGQMLSPTQVNARTRREERRTFQWRARVGSPTCRDSHFAGSAAMNTADQVWKMKPHMLQVVGLRPASRARSPSGKKQMATMICQAAKPPWAVGLEHLGHEIIAIDELLNDYESSLERGARRARHLASRPVERQAQWFMSA